ncbi:hypothetical protein A3A93_05525 [Candidatus Roizmanbacteria bacterium RIFCSPLOWO2_01_FULL_38_12]|uniref:Four helix bundle protein n=1 Tax=Candidatus Roizmanbacteria bacterium RIFCSPLOWO2_01_FULL_38_12 TaxID=1802061 RepID=A0A1F7IZ58_9BACT|nr:MAG: hypothetical protein A3F59_06280 [Candidatus Roizmanbacteria bacterium RIFCSPHIGHO2_12_FULL_38_13]OGK48647.1 MAG: hypothetical protein A3A93_05525 [Candidatus Roizmanbacteria bacterium RIFCSPLOWO2_01_FULL_38_12]
MEKSKKNNFHDDLKEYMDQLVTNVYIVTKSFPKEEVYGITSQLRRSALSIILNYIEGYARHNKKVYKNFLEISFGSLKETKYLLYFCHKMKYINDRDYYPLHELTENIGKMLWGVINKM